MTTPPAEGPAPHGAGPRPHDGDLLSAYARMIADELTLHLPYPLHFTYEEAPIVDEVQISDEEWAEVRRRWRKVIESREVQVWPPLPRRTRLKLALDRARTRALIARLKITWRW